MCVGLKVRQVLEITQFNLGLSKDDENAVVTKHMTATVKLAPQFSLCMKKF